ncbi:uncharacterized protein [Miscanthus floridulus]|uniref:uncharacterized protein n=1 Tax=Miscanthus floridulus TaxID=154761 RepID=UPI003457EE26
MASASCRRGSYPSAASSSIRESMDGGAMSLCCGGRELPMQLRIGLTGRVGRRGGSSTLGEHEPVGLEDAVHAASLVAGAPPPDSVTRFLAARSARELREIVGLLEGHGRDALRLLQEQVPGLAAAVELARHLIDMAVADFKDNIAASAAGVMCF